ncbi:MAG TPA: hypothetical protein VEA99_16960 [Gemmatimonadaceae bacterium]|nr:hypothetical protein [Gemmatimonadaceae bacterium]
MCQISRARGALALVVTLVVAAACRLEHVPPPPDTGSAEAAVDSAADAAGVETGEELTSFRRDKHFDFTGDGRPEEVKIRARGARSDRLEITLRIEDPSDSVLYRDAWTSAAYLKYVDARTRADRRAVRALVQRELERVVSDSSYGEPVARRLRRAADGNDASRSEALRYDVAEAIWRQRRGVDSVSAGDQDSIEALVRTRPDRGRVQRLLADVNATDRYFMYFRGGEDRVAVAWSPSERRFVKFWRCC